MKFESVAIEMQRSDDFEPDWEWVQLTAMATAYNFEVGFVDGYVWRDFETGKIGQMYGWLNTSEDLLQFLHNNPFETETITLKVYR